jgi:hypothetical protein
VFVMHEQPVTESRHRLVMKLESPTQAEACDQRAVMLNIVLRDVVEQAAALADHQHQPTTAVMITLVNLQVFGQVRDPLGEQRDLDIW